MSRRLVIDCDPGNGVPFADIDDGLALALALRSPDLYVEAITIVAGNTVPTTGVRVAQAIVEAAGVRTPVLGGIDSYGGPDASGWRRILDGRRDEAAWRRFGGERLIAEDETVAIIGTDPVDGLLEAVLSGRGDVTVAALGPLTNVAEAIRREPEFVRAAQEIIVMGGCFDDPRMPQELNFGYDPDAARTVIGSGARVSLIPFDVTSSTLLTSEQCERLNTPDPLSSFLHRTVQPWIRSSEARFGMGGCYLHDPLVIAALIDPTLVTWNEYRVGIVLSDPIARGRSIRWTVEPPILGGGTLALPDSPPIRVATKVDAERFSKQLIAGILRPGGGQ